jgi:hypothetical protein
MHAYFLSENLKERDHTEDPDGDGKIMSEWILGEMGWETVDWIHLSHNFVNNTFKFVSEVRIFSMKLLRKFPTGHY